MNPSDYHNSLVEFYLPFLVPDEEGQLIGLTVQEGTATLQAGQCGGLLLCPINPQNYGPWNMPHWAQIRLSKVNQTPLLVYTLELDEYYYNTSDTDYNFPILYPSSNLALSFRGLAKPEVPIVSIDEDRFADQNARQGWHQHLKAKYSLINFP